jgi:cytochrome c oxidase subunit 2
MVDPAGPKAAAVHDFWWFLIITSTIVFIVVVGALLYGLLKRRRDEPTPLVDAASEARIGRVVGGAVLATALVLAVFLTLNWQLERAIAAPEKSNPLTINVIGRQWWWEVQYPDSLTASNWITTANEIHIPVGRPVRLRMTARDVIHSFWVPNLSGKKDLVPGRVTETWFQADTPGVYRGQCAEFCGHQHAKMAVLVIAHRTADFHEWVAAQRAPSAQPGDSLRSAGQRVFLAGSCALCHAIAGTPASGRIGPDLTHIGSRRTLAAGSLPNTRGHLGEWIRDPQRVKPGVYMPPNALEPNQLEALLSYLEGLK